MARNQDRVPLEESCALGCFLCSLSRHLPNHEAIKQTNPDFKDVAPRHIDIYLYSQEARSPRLLFLLAPSLASDSRRLEHGNASKTNRKSCARTPPGPTLGSVIGQFNFRMTASLLGKTATVFCRERQLERPGDVICEGIGASVLRRRHLSLHIPLHGLSVSHVMVCDASLRRGHFCCKCCA